MSLKSNNTIDYITAVENYDTDKFNLLSKNISREEQLIAFIEIYSNNIYMLKYNYKNLTPDLIKIKNFTINILENFNWSTIIKKNQKEVLNVFSNYLRKMSFDGDTFEQVYLLFYNNVFQNSNWNKNTNERWYDSNIEDLHSVSSVKSLITVLNYPISSVNKKNENFLLALDNMKKYPFTKLEVNVILNSKLAKDYFSIQENYYNFIKWQILKSFGEKDFNGDNYKIGSSLFLQEFDHIFSSKIDLLSSYKIILEKDVRLKALIISLCNNYKLIDFMYEKDKTNISLENFAHMFTKLYSSRLNESGNFNDFFSYLKNHNKILLSEIEKKIDTSPNKDLEMVLLSLLSIKPLNEKKVKLKI